MAKNQHQIEVTQGVGYRFVPGQCCFMLVWGVSRGFGHCMVEQRRERSLDIFGHLWTGVCCVWSLGSDSCSHSDSLNLSHRSTDTNATDPNTSKYTLTQHTETFLNLAQISSVYLQDLQTKLSGLKRTRKRWYGLHWSH